MHINMYEMHIFPDISYISPYISLYMCGDSFFCNLQKVRAGGASGTSFLKPGHGRPGDGRPGEGWMDGKDGWMA